jgi:glutamate synthase (NADPH/NADH) small chain
VVIYEALHEPGGVLVYGIPEFRLPKKIVHREIEVLKSMGVEIVTNAVAGKLFTIDEIMKEFDACFIGSGAGLPKFMNIDGENLNGVYSANEFLTRINLMRAYQFPEFDTPVMRGDRVAVFGGGNVAMDAARTALRIGAEEVILIYRRSLTELPARKEEVHHAQEEGIRFELCTNPVRILGNDQAQVRAVECVRMDLCELDESGRRSPKPIKGSEFEIPVNVAIVALGTGANPLIPQSAKNLQVNKRLYIIADEETGRTSIEGVYAGGDIVTGSATVISAMGAARAACGTRAGSETDARSINQTPPSQAGASSSAAPMASRVLPTPPGPVSVTMRAVSRARAISFNSAARPTSGVGGHGRRLARAPPSGGGGGSLGASLAAIVRRR